MFYTELEWCVWTAMEWVQMCKYDCLKANIEKKSLKKLLQKKFEEGWTKTVILHHLSHIYIRILQNTSSVFELEQKKTPRNTWHEHWTKNNKKRRNISPLLCARHTHNIRLSMNVSNTQGTYSSSRSQSQSSSYKLSSILNLVYYFNGHYCDRNWNSLPMVSFCLIVQNGLLWCVHVLNITMGQRSILFLSFCWSRVNNHLDFFWLCRIRDNIKFQRLSSV